MRKLKSTVSGHFQTFLYSWKSIVIWRQSIPIRHQATHQKSRRQRIFIVHAVTWNKSTQLHRQQDTQHPPPQHLLISPQQHHSMNVHLAANTPQKSASGLLYCYRTCSTLYPYQNRYMPWITANTRDHKSCHGPCPRLPAVWCKVAMPCWWYSIKHASLDTCHRQDSKMSMVGLGAQIVWSRSFAKVLSGLLAPWVIIPLGLRRWQGWEVSNHHIVPSSFSPFCWIWLANFWKSRWNRGRISDSILLTVDSLSHYFGYFFLSLLLFILNLAHPGHFGPRRMIQHTLVSFVIVTEVSTNENEDLNETNMFCRVVQWWWTSLLVIHGHEYNSFISDIWSIVLYLAWKKKYQVTPNTELKSLIALAPKVVQNGYVSRSSIGRKKKRKKSQI